MLPCRVLNVWDTVLHSCIPQRYRFDEDDDSSEHIEAGRVLLGKEQVWPHNGHGRGYQTGAALRVYECSSVGREDFRTKLAKQCILFALTGVTLRSFLTSCLLLLLLESAPPVALSGFAYAHCSSRQHACCPAQASANAPQAWAPHHSLPVQDAQLQGLPVGDACGFSTAPQQEPASSQKVTLLGRAPTSSSSFRPASAHPTSRSAR